MSEPTRPTASAILGGNSKLPEPLPQLGSLMRKAVVDAGFDLEPEIDAGWWRLRSSAVPGVAWIHARVAPASVLLALPLTEQLAAIVEAGRAIALDGEAYPPPPLGAAGVVVCETPAELHADLRHVWSLRFNSAEHLRRRWEAGVAAALGPADGSEAIGATAISPLATEVVAEVRRRIGQNLYREALLDFWEGRCAVTGLAIPELLRASHAKPWADANDAERLDAHNGVLLAVHLDALFDRGFLTFDDAGQGVLSRALPLDARALLGISEQGLALRWVRAAHQPYLAWHRQHVFRAIG